jgi:aspartokinase
VVAAELAEGALRQLRRRLDASRHALSLEVRRQVSVVAVLGAAIEPTRVTARVLEALRDEAIESLALSLPCLSGHSGEHAVAVLVDDAEVPRAVRRLHHELVTASPASPSQGASLRRAQSRQEPLMRLL